MKRDFGVSWVVPVWAVATVVLAQPIASSAAPAPHTLAECTTALDSEDYQDRAAACRVVRKHGPGWLAGSGPDAPGNGDDSIDPCGDSPRVRTVFEGTTFARTTGAPNVFLASFRTLARGSVCVKVTNDQVASAAVAVDGTGVLSTDDFNATVTSLVGRHDVEAGDHALGVILASAPGSSLSIEVRFALTDDLVELVEFFETALADADASVIREALTAAADVPLQEVQEILAEVVERESGNFSSVTVAIGIRAFATSSAALFDVDDPELAAAVTTLGTVLTTDRSSTARSVAAQGLAALGHPSGIDVLEAAALTEENDLVFLAIRGAIGQLAATLEGAP